MATLYKPKIKVTPEEASSDLLSFANPFGTVITYITPKSKTGVVRAIARFAVKRYPRTMKAVDKLSFLSKLEHPTGEFPKVTKTTKGITVLPRFSGEKSNIALRVPQTSKPIGRTDAEDLFETLAHELRHVQQKLRPGLSKKYKGLSLKRLREIQYEGYSPDELVYHRNAPDEIDARIAAKSALDKFRRLKVYKPK